MNALQTWSIEYNHSSGSFHLGRTGEMLNRNVKSVDIGSEVDFICIGIFPTKEQAESAMLEFRRKRKPCKTIAML
ncbi:MAG: hypothetical protein AAFP70_09385 [Calditrichota bacterium]